MEFLDIEYIKEKLLSLEDKPSVINKFFSGKIVDEIVDLLFEQNKKDKQKKEPSDEYKKIKRCYEIIKRMILEKDLPRFFPILTKLFKGNLIWVDSLSDIERLKNRVPEECINEVLNSLIAEILNFDLETKNQVFGLVDSISSKNKIENSNIFDPFEEIFTELFNEDEQEKESINLGKNYFIKFGKKKIRKEVKINIWNKLISTIDPLANIKKSNEVFNFCLENSSELEPENKEILLSLMESHIYDPDMMNNEDASNFWLKNSELVMEWYDENQLGRLVKETNDGKNLIRLDETRIDITKKENIVKIINMVFKNISIDQQGVHLNTLQQFLQDENQNNYQFAIKNIHSIKNNLKKKDLIKPFLPILSDILSSDQDEEIQVMNVRTQFSFKDFLDQPQKEKAIDHILKLCPSKSEFCHGFFIENWALISTPKKIKFIICILKTDIKNDIKKKNELSTKMGEVLINLNSEEKTKLLDQYVNGLSVDMDEYNFFHLTMNKIKKHFDVNLKDKIRNNYIDKIKEEEKGNINKNRFSVICSFKKKYFEKDDEVFYLFFNLLSSRKEKINLAIDNIIIYYENKAPYRKKIELASLLKDVYTKVNKEYRDKIQKISDKLNLHIRPKRLGFFRSKSD